MTKINKFNLSELKNVPNKPGCYLWKDINNKIIYIGKAKNLNKRMNQYFSKVNNNRTNKLVNSINSFDYIVTLNENDALILENNLIKKHQPKFNVLLKEGSNSYPYILITNHQHPKIVYTRKYDPTKGKYYGPFASSDTKAYDLYIYLNRIFPLRKCKVLKKDKCMYYDIGQCLAPCINKIKLEDYKKIIDQIDDIFHNKNNKKIINELQDKEQLAAKELNFEKAQYYLDLQKKFQSIVSDKIAQLNQTINADFIGYYSTSDKLCINIFNYINGKLIAKHENIENIYGDEISEIIISYLMQFYSENKIPKNIFVSLDENDLNLLSNTLNTKIYKPNKGKNLELLTQAITNAKYFFDKNELLFASKFNKTQGACQALAKLLKIHDASYIEMIDNSNIFLEYPVSGIVVFKNGQPERKEYRYFNLDHLEKKSDFHFMEYTIERRFVNKIKNNELLPNVFIVDGGKAQVLAAKNIFYKFGIENKVILIGLKKDKKHKTSSIILSNFQEIKLDKNTNLYLLLLSIQEEAHRFIIEFFRKKHIKSKFETIIDDVKGLGEKTKQKLLKIYPNVLSIKDINIETLAQIMPLEVATRLKDKINDFLNNKK